MKHLFFALFTALMFVACKSEPVELKIVSYNIRYGDAKDGDNSWENRKTATPAMIKAIDPDCFGLQEAKDFQIDYICENCPEYEHYGVGREDGVSDGEHMTIFFKKDKFELLSSETFWLSETPEKPSMGWDAACKRTATAVLLKHKKSGKKFYYVNTHLDHVGREAQTKGLQLIVNRIAEMNPEKLPLFLTGDFNLSPFMSPILALDELMLSARDFADQTDWKRTFTGFRKPKLEPKQECAKEGEACDGKHEHGEGHQCSGEGKHEHAEGHQCSGNHAEGHQCASKPAVELKGKDRRPTDLKKLGGVIDYVYYSKEGVAAVPEFRTIDESFESIPFISDHYPVMARFILE